MTRRQHPVTDECVTDVADAPFEPVSAQCATWYAPTMEVVS